MAKCCKACRSNRRRADTLIDRIDPALRLRRGWHHFSSTDAWDGMAAGAAMIGAIMWLRPKRDDA